MVETDWLINCWCVDSRCHDDEGAAAATGHDSDGEHSGRGECRGGATSSPLLPRAQLASLDLRHVVETEH